jgi:hypothetical protein
MARIIVSPPDESDAGSYHRFARCNGDHSHDQLQLLTTAIRREGKMARLLSRNDKAWLLRP